MDLALRAFEQPRQNEFLVAEDFGRRGAAVRRPDQHLLEVVRGLIQGLRQRQDPRDIVLTVKGFPDSLITGITGLPMILP
jgi:hypothetical protein